VTAYDKQILIEGKNLVFSPSHHIVREGRERRGEKSSRVAKGIKNLHSYSVYDTTYS